MFQFCKAHQLRVFQHLQRARERPIQRDNQPSVMSLIRSLLPGMSLILLPVMNLIRSLHPPAAPAPRGGGLRSGERWSNGSNVIPRRDRPGGLLSACRRGGRLAVRFGLQLSPIARNFLQGLGLVGWPEEDCVAPRLRPALQEGSCKATWKREWREAGPPHHHDDTVDSDQ